MNNYSKSKTRVVLLHAMPTSYRMSFFNQLYSKVEGIVYFFTRSTKGRSQWDIDEILKNATFKYEFLKGITIERVHRYAVHLCPVLLWHLFIQKPDVIICGDFNFQTLLARFYTFVTRRKLVIFSDTTPYTRSKHPIRVFLRRWIIPGASAFIAASSQTREYFRHLGAKNESIFDSIQTFDVVEWSKVVCEQKKRKDSLKRRFGLREKVLLYVGRLHPIKGCIYLLEVFYQISKEMNNVSLLVVGDGPETERLKSYCKEKNLLQKVIFTGFKQPKELPVFYAISDFFIFPTLWDPFGLVVNEALAAGLPVICSPFAGASTLIEEGNNGYIVNPRDTNKLKSILKSILTDEQLLKKLQRGAIASIPKFTVEKSVEGFLQAISYVLGNRNS